MTKKEYREAYRLTDREKAQVWNEVRAPRARHPHRPRRWLPALGGLAAAACAVAIAVILTTDDDGRGPLPATQDVAVRSSEQPAAAPPAPRNDRAVTILPEKMAAESGEAMLNEKAMAPQRLTASRDVAEVAVPGTGVIRGQIHDQETGVALAFAAVTIQGTAIGAMTDSLGVFTLAGLSPGAHTLEVRYLGYDPATIPLEVVAGDTLVRDIAMPAVVVATLESSDVDAARYMVEIKQAVGEKSGTASSEGVPSVPGGRSSEMRTMARQSLSSPAPNTRTEDCGGTTSVSQPITPTLVKSNIVVTPPAMTPRSRRPSRAITRNASSSSEISERDLKSACAMTGSAMSSAPLPPSSPPSSMSAASGRIATATSAPA